jgi:hypothetical protein
MKFGKVLGTLLALNLALVSYLVWVITRGSSGPDGRPASLRAPSGSNAIPVTNFVPVLVTNQFRWSQLESEDYQTYINNLRAIGCPEQTIRDIIIADLDLLWAPRIWSIYPRHRNLHYWESEEKELNNNYDQREFQRQEKSVDREKREVIRELIGADLVHERLKLQGEEDKLERRLQFLDPEKRMDLRDAIEPSQDQEWKITEKTWEEGAALTDADRAALKDIRVQREAELNRLLTPEERRQYDLWMSPAAQTVRHDLYGMNATEQEFLQVYNLQKDFEAQWHPNEINFEDPSQAAAWERANAELESKVQETLGPERYAEYQRGQDEDFHLLNAAVSRYELDRDKAAAVYEYKRVLAQEQERVVMSPDLTLEQREAALKAMEAETQVAVKEVLGQHAYNYYRRRADWLR